MLSTQPLAVRGIGVVAKVYWRLRARYFIDNSELNGKRLKPYDDMIVGFRLFPFRFKILF